jgi:hydroxymethylglutaryl-CoA lyase
MMFKNLTKHAKVVEVGPRDGLQNEAAVISTKDKVTLITSLVKSGIKNIELTSFVSPKWIPQLADAEDVCHLLKALPSDINTSALVPNARGYERTKESKLSCIAVFMSATETHSKKNINKSIAEALGTIAEVVSLAKKDNRKVRAYLSVVFACPYEGQVNPDSVVELCRKLIEMEIDELSLGDTIGAATPIMVLNLLDKIKSLDDLNKFALHFHDTRGMALVNVAAGLEAGITTFDSSIGGMGGCPYAPGAAGNLATEDLVYFLHSLNIETGIDLAKLIDCGRLAEQIIGRTLPGRYLRAAIAEQKIQK